MGKFTDIIERVEYIRNDFGLNKSRFSGEIGMKPQTYNNFIGSQGSKPNIELIHGVVNRFNVNPTWLLNGTGEVYIEGGGPGDMKVSFGLRNRSSSVREPETEFLYKEHAELLQQINQSLNLLDPILREMEEGVRQLEGKTYPLLEGLMRILRKYFEIDPVGATRDIGEIIENLKTRTQDSQNS